MELENFSNVHKLLNDEDRVELEKCLKDIGLYV